MNKPLLQNLFSILAGLVFVVALGGGAMAQDATGLPALNMICLLYTSPSPRD